MLGHVELDLIIVDKDLLEVGLQIVPAELARALKIDPSRRLERGCNPLTVVLWLKSAVRSVIFR